MSKKMTTKDKLLLIIKKEGEIPIKSLMEHSTISEISIRHHLRELITQKLIEERSVKQEVGRPFIQYKLTSTGHNTFPNQDTSLPLETLHDVQTISRREALKSVLNEPKERETDSDNTEDAGKPFKEQIPTVSDLLDKQVYMVEYNENNDSSYDIINYNWPVYNIA